MSGYGQPLLLDNSAWARALDNRLSGAHREAFDGALVEGGLWTCPPTLLEMRYSARDDRGFEQLAKRLDALTFVPQTAEVSARALSAQSELAVAKGISHRVKPVDLLIAAVAAAAGVGVLHYDRDYDTIAAHTSLAFSSVWVAPRGSID